MRRGIGLVVAVIALFAAFGFAIEGQLQGLENFERQLPSSSNCNGSSAVADSAAAARRKEVPRWDPPVVYGQSSLLYLGAGRSSLG